MSKPRPPGKLLATAIAVSVCSAVPVAYYTSVLNVPQDVFEDFLNSSQRDRGKNLSEHQITGIWAVTVALYSAGGLLGAIMLRFVAEKFGRKRSLMHIVTIVFIVSSILMAIAKPLVSIELLAIGRLGTGVASGLAVGLVPMFLTECSPDEFRGTIGTLFGIFASVGTLLVLCLGLPTALGTDQNWPYLVTLGCVFPAAMMAMSPLIPESPKYLFLTAHKDLEAIKSLQFYYGHRIQTRTILEGFRREEGFRRINLWTIVSRYQLRKPLMLSILLVMAKVSTGMGIIQSYSTDLLVDLGFDRLPAKQWSIAISFVGLLANITATFLVGRFPRRTLLIRTLIALVICNVLLSIMDTVEQDFNKKQVAYGSLFILLMHTVIYQLGPGPVINFLPGELSPQAVRSTVFAMATFVQWSSSVLIQMLFLPISRSLGPWTYIILFVIPSALVIVILWLDLPETKNRSIAEIMHTWIKNDDEQESLDLELMPVNINAHAPIYQTL